MAKVYIKYTPVKAGLTGSEFLAPFLDEHFNGVTFSGVISDDMIHFGYIEGDGDLVSKALMAIEGRFSIKKITEDELIGFAEDNYVPIDDGITPPMTLVDYLGTHSITVSDELGSVKAMKKVLFKEVAKKQFDDYNDLIADVCRVVTLLNGHYPDLDAPTKAAVDANMTTLKAIYDQASCVASLDSMVTNLQTILTGYYTACVNVDAAADKAAAKAVEYNG